MELAKQFSFPIDICIYPKECWDLILLDMSQIFVCQVLHKNLDSFRPVICQIVQDVLLSFWNKVSKLILLFTRVLIVVDSISIDLYVFVAIYHSRN